MAQETQQIYNQTVTMRGRSKDPDVQELWDAYNESRAVIKAEAVKLFELYHKFCLKHKEYPRKDNDFLGLLLVPAVMCSYGV